MTRFNGKAALLTGAASGVGRATAIRLADEGASVFAVDLNAEGLHSLTDESAQLAGVVETRVCDVSSVEQCGEAVEACVGQFGRLDVLGNIAGISWQDRVADVTEKDWDLMFGVNVKGPFFLTQAALPYLLKSAGSVINIASNTGVMGMAYTVLYSATKGAIVQLTRSLAMEFVKTPVRVNAIAPGGINTPMTQNYRVVEDMDWDLLRHTMGFRGMSEPEQISALFAFLVSDEAQNIHGAIIHADHGLTAG